MQQQIVPSFEQLLCSDVRVRRLAERRTPLGRWWRAILWLHRRPVAHDLTNGEVHAIIRSGYRRYVATAVLATPLAGAAAALASSWQPISRAAAALACAALLASSVCGAAGMRAFRFGAVPTDRRLAHSVAWLIVALLLLLLALAVESPLPLMLTAASAALLAAFGIGSLGIEVVYALPTPPTGRG